MPASTTSSGPASTPTTSASTTSSGPAQTHTTGASTTSSGPAQTHPTGALFAIVVMLMNWRSRQLHE
ncbi:expressed protein [Echinococcus multilocularis]|uniref:Expressed protein n=1 Tax=Echinococcus multilocularis TaxID=6211 RepID=A0A087VX26_ECHMU|nr:expressed protein [Echinococcus multilocularis]